MEAYVLVVNDDSQVIGYKIFGGYVGLRLTPQFNEISVYSFSEEMHKNIVAVVYFSEKYALAEAARHNATLADRNISEEHLYKEEFMNGTKRLRVVKLTDIINFCKIWK